MFMGQDGFIWWIGVVEDNNDPLLIGRARIRIFGYHPKAKRDETYSNTANNAIPTSYLPWAIPILPLNMPNAYGKIGVGEWVFGFFMDGEAAQEPAILGYIPSAYRQGEFTFSKSVTPRTFYDLEGAIPDGEYKSIDFVNKSNRFEWHTPSNHHIRITEVANEFGNKDFVLAHSTGNLFVAMQSDKNGNSALALSHPNGHRVILHPGHIELSVWNGTSSLIIDGSEITVRTPKGAYPLVDQLNWISLQQHTTQGGSKRGPRNFTIGTRANPPPPPPSGRRGGGCFIPTTMVTLADSSKKRIDEIEIGDYVLSFDKKTINRVRFIEIVDGERHKTVYTPNNTYEAFATIDHPLYLYGQLSAVDPYYTESLYPWLGKQEKIYLPFTSDNKYLKVYNLWVDGDGTYIVNGYGTSSIIYDGGMLSDFLERGYFDADKIQELYKEYTTRGEFLLHGAFVLNYIVGKLKSDLLYKLVAYGAKAELNSIRRKLIVDVPMYIASTFAHTFEVFHKWKMFKAK